MTMLNDEMLTISESEKLYIDKYGSLWRGPIQSEDNLHYAKLSGITNGLRTGIHRPIWVLEKTDADKDWLLVGNALTTF